MLAKTRAILQNFADASQHEWLETNGLGGWASSTIIGANTRRYHGLLTAAIAPPTDRMVLLAKLDETIVTAEKRIELGVNVHSNNTISPLGHHYLNRFTKELFPEWEYEAHGVRLRKTVAMVHGENTTLIIYDVIEAAQPFTLELAPLMAARGYHSLAKEGPQMHWYVDFADGIFHNQPDGVNHLYISVPGAAYEHTPRWFTGFEYPVEQYRGLGFTEDLFNHGTFSVEMKQGHSIGIIVSTEDVTGRNAHELLSREGVRRKLLISHQPDDEIIQQLVLAADQFVVKRGENLKTVIAGYHWFTDWGRDTMISLPGLCLSTGRYDDAKKILAAFAANVSMGMLPNRFTDNGEEPEYNNVDATLWYFIAVHKYMHITGDADFILKDILPVLKEIIDWHFTGTRYHIHAESDGLLYSGEPGQQLTWMDARVGDWVVTPRMGKPVEIQALWYNALRIFSELLHLNGQQSDAIVVNVSAEKIKENFESLYWYEAGQYLYDNINEKGEPVTEFRPNQLFAISLPFALIEGDKAIAILQNIDEHLYTPVGLKTLPKNDARYAPVYGGDQLHRDGAYHEGTVWSWLLGPYVDALVKVGVGKPTLQKVIENFAYHLNENCIGSVSEIFDAEPPHHPRGCIAQAWGVAEILRVIKDYRLYDVKTERTGMKMVTSESVTI